jgi:Putative zinc finger in N-recognin (UBR box)
MEDLNLTATQQRAYDSVRRILASPPGDFLETSPIPSLVKLEWTAPAAPAPATATATATSTTTTSPATALVSVAARPPLPALVVAARAALPGAEAAAADDDDDPEVVTIVTPSRGHHELYRRLEELEGLEKEESTLLERSDVTVTLTSVVTGQPLYEGGPPEAVQHLYRLGQAVPRRVCQHPFRKNDIVWVCKTCQADETCVLCHSCFSQSNHEGHDVAFYHAQAGGCCDCGDPDGAS